MALFANGQNVSGGGSGSGGHTIQDNNGTDLTQRGTMQFVGAYSEDDNTNEKTVVGVMRTMSVSDFKNLSQAEKQGFIYCPDETTGTDDKFQPVIYSLEEREIGVWTDGKPLYEKTLEFNVSELSAGENEIRDIFDIPIDSLVKSAGSYFKENWGGPVPGYHNNSAWAVSVYNVYKKGLWLYIGNSVYSTLSSSGKIFVTLQYTKTTDQPGSGKWTSQGIPTVHYSTDEKVVGTWIDGSTIYEITTDMGTAGVSIGSGASVDSNIPVGNIDKIVYSTAISQSGKCFPVIGAEQGDTYIKMINMGGSSRNVRWFTIQYTKSS